MNSVLPHFDFPSFSSPSISSFPSVQNAVCHSPTSRSMSSRDTVNRSISSVTAPRLTKHSVKSSRVRCSRSCFEFDFKLRDLQRPRCDGLGQPSLEVKEPQQPFRVLFYRKLTSQPPMIAWKAVREVALAFLRRPSFFRPRLRRKRPRRSFLWRRMTVGGVDHSEDLSGNDGHIADFSTNAVALKRPIDGDVAAWANPGYHIGGVGTSTLAPCEPIDAVLGVRLDG